MKGKRLITTAAAGAAFAAIAPGAAQAAPPGVCQLTAHLQLANGSYSADAGSVECSGIVGAQPVHGGGYLESWGSYAEQACTLVWRENLLFVRIPEAIEFFGPTYVDSEGGYTLTGPASAMQLSGSGDNDGQPFRATGTATFTPDQSGCDVRSGTLTETMALVDGGNGNPAAADAINRYERSAYPSFGGGSDAGTTQSAPVTNHSASITHGTASRRKHHKHHKSHRAARRQSR